MKLFTSAQIRSIEQASIADGSYHSRELMDRAASVFLPWFMDRIDRQQDITVYCGTGNNGADGLVIGEKLHHVGYRVELVILQLSSGQSEDFTYHLTRLKQIASLKKTIVTKAELCPFPGKGVIIDAIFGSGLSRPLQKPYTTLVDNINSLTLKTYAVDIPSGLPGEKAPFGIAIRATETCSFQFPRLTSLTREGYAFTGACETRSIDLSPPHIAGMETNYFLIERETIRGILKKRHPYAHKGTYGHVHVIGGTRGMAGAAIMTARAALMGGAGLCSISSDPKNLDVFQSAIPEAMIRPLLKGALPQLNSRDTVAVGPGLGQSDQAVTWLQAILRDSKKPLVIDADAINILAALPDRLSALPPESIITPHPGEFARLVGPWTDTFDRLEKQQHFSRQNQCYVVLKDHHTAITNPSGQVYFNKTGNAGMATGGSGDVLTGLIAGFIAQSYPALEAALASVYIHGLAGDIGSLRLGQEALTAPLLLEYIGEAFLNVQRKSAR